MSEITQRTELQAAIWRIADEVRGAVDGWDFKQFVLGSLFYRFISENFVAHMEGDNPQRRYEEYADSEISANAGMIDEVTREKGYFIYPSQLFSVVVAQADHNPNLNTDLAAIFSAIEASAVGYDSERAVKGLFADFDTTSTRLGNTVEEKNRRLCAVLHGVESLDFGRFADHKIDLFGDAYEFLISNYAANAGKSGGEFFTPQNVSLLLQAKRQFDQDLIKEGFVGQEINHTTYNLARMNLFLHDVNYSKFDLALGDTLLSPQHRDTKPFDAIVSNPPYSVKWVGSDDPTLINDERFAPAGVLAPKSKADFAFVLHALNHLSARGRAAIVCFPGIFYRGGAEQKIRQYLVDNNFVETVIALAPNLFFGTSIAVCILVLSKHKTDTRTQFIDASGEEFFRKETKNNVLTPEQIDRIVSLFEQKVEEPHVSALVEHSAIAANDYNLSVSSYVEARDTREVIDIDLLNAEVSETVGSIDALRRDIDTIIAELSA